ncbi:ABC transporter permease [Patescibacteria group bacterium]
MKNIFLPIFSIWYREILRFWRDRFKAIAFFVFPILWVIFFGSGLASAFIPKAALDFPGTFEYFDYLIPGILGLTVGFTAIFSAITFVTDREYGYLREILVSPSPRLTIILGKVLGGATVALAEGVLMSAALIVIGLKLEIGIALMLIPILALLALTLSSLGVILATYIRSTEAFPVIIQVLFMPLLLLSGALFPLKDSPFWMEAISFVNPATYGIDALRSVSLANADLPSALLERFSIVINGYVVPFWLDLVILAAIFIVCLLLSAWRLSRTR